MYEKIKNLIVKNPETTKEEFKIALSSIFNDSLSMSKIFNDILEQEFLTFDDEPLPDNYKIYANNFYNALTVALENGLNPNELVPYGDGEGGTDNIMWTVVGTAGRSNIAPKIIKLLLDYGGDPNLKLDEYDTVFTEVDDFFWIDGDDLEENLLMCWLLLAVYGGDKDNFNFLPLKMLNGHKQDELKNYENYSFSFETVKANTYKREKVLFIIDKQTGEKVAVNETPFG